MMVEKSGTPTVNPAALYPLLSKVYRLLAVIELRDLDMSAPVLIGWVSKQLDNCQGEVERIRKVLDAEWISHLER
jgi:hypothetical protein